MEKILNVNIGTCKPLLSPDELKKEIDDAILLYGDVLDIEIYQISDTQCDFSISIEIEELTLEKKVVFS